MVQINVFQRAACNPLVSCKIILVNWDWHLKNSTRKELTVLVCIIFVKVNNVL